MPLRSRTVVEIWSPGLVGVGLILIGLGIAFRWANLGQVYWHDEAYTALRLSGFTGQELNQHLFRGEVVSVAQVMDYQWPNSVRSIWETVRALAIDDAQHPPVYYLLAWLWVKTFGASIPAIRSLSVIISCLSLPAMYGWCQELFRPTRWAVSSYPQLQVDAKLVGGFAVLILALSPFHILYAQEAREYALWILLTIVINALFWRGLRGRGWGNWLAYGSCLTLGLYTFPLTGFVSVGHGFYLLLMNRQKLQAWGVSTLISFGLFAPWLYILVTTWNVTGATWTALPISQANLWQAMGLNLVRVFVWTDDSFDLSTGIIGLLFVVLLILLVASIYTLWRTTPPCIWLFLLILAGATFLPLFLPDLFWGGQRSTSGRYLIPTILVIEITVAYFLAWHVSRIQPSQRILGWTMTGLVIGLGLVSGVAITATETSWIKLLNYSFPQIYRQVNQHPQPLVIGLSGNINTGTMLALAHGITPQAQFVLIDAWDSNQPPELPIIPDGQEPIFFLNPTPELLTGLEETQNLAGTLIFQDKFLQLWQLHRHN
ncbi:glycosyltransferase family 39 protein [Synechococcus sp. PCC 6312]|uniref:glycosyltransferase family 39 protein n=1 Tax=Synechococcus sp. (strain ATCC 27167 / PCC 6312) TaxID=195253 RepID=UPI00029ECA1C|nr:glycosyltransferase family 39 protein [Synechococcus sp. PCC 6312]AFY59431.1 putative membrane protein [Synechococcus sp. PCC 6312]